MKIDKGRDIVLFLGAGFSSDADLPTMARFGEESDEEGKRIQKHKGRWKAYEMYSNAYRGYKEVQNIFERAQRFVDIDVNNMETIFCMAEAMSESNIEAITEEKRKEIKRWLWKIYQQCPPVQRGKEGLAVPYFNLIKSIKNCDSISRINVITTNYDLVFEYMTWKEGIKCAYPFEGENADKCRLLEYDRPYVILRPDVDSPIVCKLHGSISYFEKDHSRTLFILDNIVPYFTSKKIKIGESCIPNLPEIFAFDALYELDRREMPNIPAIIPPTYAKLEGRPWLREIWNAAFKAIQNAKYIIFIGYSMPQTDGFMYAMIRSAMAMREDERCLKIFIIDPNPSEGYIKLFRKVIAKYYPYTFKCAQEKGYLDDIFRECMM